MNILICNDDGYLAQGIAVLARVAAEFANVRVVAPERNRSGVSNSLTLDRPLLCQRHTDRLHPFGVTCTARIQARFGVVRHQSRCEYGGRYPVFGHGGGSNRSLFARLSRRGLFLKRPYRPLLADCREGGMAVIGKIDGKSTATAGFVERQYPCRCRRRFARMQNHAAGEASSRTEHCADAQPEGGKGLLDWCRRRSSRPGRWNRFCRMCRRFYYRYAVAD